MWITRIYEKTLRDVLRHFPAVVLTGARQVGKTSLARRVCADADYVSLDLPSLAAQAESTPDDFLRQFREPLIIDEVQYAPSLFRQLKSVIDVDRRPGRFLLTGSQLFPLMQGVSESLAGRSAVLRMHGLSGAELAEAGYDVTLDDLIFRGGFPELHAQPLMPAHIWHASYVATYLERDVRNIMQVGNLRDFERFLRAAAARIGAMLSYSELARDVGISPNTAKQWISVLQTSGQLFLLEPYHRNIGKRLVKTPKLYFCDSGLAMFLLGFEDWRAVLRHPMAGQLWENYVVMEIVRHYSAKGRDKPIWFWRTAQGEEVDLLVEEGGRFVAVEAKYTENPDQRDIKGISSLTQAHGPDAVLSALVVCRTPHVHKLGAVGTAVPVDRLPDFLP